MTLPEAQAILAYYGQMAYPNKLQARTVAQARAVVQDAAEAAMRVEMKGICIKCSGDGFHRIDNNLLSGPCELCKGGGRSEMSPHQSGGGA